jgi:uncharacterized membrane protein
MHLRRLITLLLGAWFACIGVVAFTATVTFRTAAAVARVPP